MSVTLREVIESGGYDLSKLEDAQWLVSQEDNFNELLEEAEDLIEKHEEAEAEDED